MQLTLSSESVLHTTITNDSGQVLYKTLHPFIFKLGTTTIQKIKPNSDPMDMRDQFEVMAEIEWHVFGSSVFRINGQELRSNDFLPQHGIMRSKRTFTGPDGLPYRWDILYDTVVLSRDNVSRTEVARYQRLTRDHWSQEEILPTCRSRGHTRWIGLS